MYLFECEATFGVEPAEVWKVRTDVARWPERDVSQEIARQGGLGSLLRLLAPKMRREIAGSLAALERQLSS